MTESPTPEALIEELAALVTAASSLPWSWDPIRDVVRDGNGNEMFGESADRRISIEAVNSLPAILTHLREFASLRARGLTLTQEHLDTLLRKAAEDEREECAKVCEEMASLDLTWSSGSPSDAGRECAYAIRSRKEST